MIVAPAVLLALLASAPKDKVVVAVFTAESKGVALDQSALERLSDYAASRLAESERYAIVPRSQLKQQLEAAKQESYKECYDQSCQIQVGKEVAAQKTLATTVIKLGSKCVATMTLYDLRTAATDRAATSEGGCTEDDIVGLLKNTIAKLTEEASATSKAAATAKPSEPAATEPPAKTEPREPAPSVTRASEPPAAQPSEPAQAAPSPQPESGPASTGESGRKLEIGGAVGYRACLSCDLGGDGGLTTFVISPRAGLRLLSGDFDIRPEISFDFIYSIFSLAGSSTTIVTFRPWLGATVLMLLVPSLELGVGVRAAFFGVPIEPDGDVSTGLALQPAVEINYHGLTGSVWSASASTPFFLDSEQSYLQLGLGVSFFL